MNGPIDFYEDEGALLAATIEYGELPAFVKTAKYAVDLAADTYALVIADDDGGPRCLFSIIDPGNTALSAHYLLHGNALPPELAKTAAMNVGARLHGFQMEVPDVLLDMAGVSTAEELHACSPYTDKKQVEKWASATLPISSDGQVAFMTASGTKVNAGKPTQYAGPPRHSPPMGPEGAKGLGVAQQKMASMDTVLAALDRFEEDFRLYEPDARLEIAGQLKLAADERGFSVGPRLELYSNGEFDLGHALMSIEARHSLVPDGQYGALAKVAATIDEAELPAIIQTMDMQYGLDRLWDAMLPDPVASVLLVKTAEMLEGVTTITSAEAVKKLALVERKTLLTYFSDSMVNSFQKDPVTVFKALPDPQRELVARLAQSHGLNG